MDLRDSSASKKWQHDSPGHSWPLGHLKLNCFCCSRIKFNICFLDSITSKWRGQRSEAPQPQQQIMGASGTSSASESSSSLQRWEGDMSISQLWHGSILFSFLVGETRRDGFRTWRFFMRLPFVNLQAILRLGLKVALITLITAGGGNLCQSDLNEVDKILTWASSWNHNGS